jgi:hypothetical protein
MVLCLANTSIHRTFRERCHRVLLLTTENAPLRHKHISLFYFCCNYYNVRFLGYFDNETRGRGSRSPSLVTLIQFSILHDVVLFCEDPFSL